MKLAKYLKEKRVSGLSILFMSAGLCMISMSAQADFSDIDPSLKTAPYTCPANPTNAQDPANHKMYVVAVNPRPYTPKATLPLVWAAGTKSKSFSFGDKELTITFSELVDQVNASNNPFFGSGSGPGPLDGTYNNGNENTEDAINVRHINNSEGQKHILDLKVNRNVSKIGYKIQDVDARGTGSLISNYKQQVDISETGGRFFENDISSTLQRVNANRNIASGVDGSRCSLGECVLDASWNYTAANRPVRLKHSNLDTSRFSLSFNYIVGYSDFYFCLAPPKVIVKKVLSGSRVTASDQFQVEVKQGTNTINSFTTTGSDATVAANISPVVTLVEDANYTITERVLGGGDISNYSANYACTNATTGTLVNFTSGALTYDPATKTRSFSIANTKYGDEITCTITNKPATYTFSGIVFNDNGGIADSQANALNANITSGVYANKPNYFDGVFNSSTESGIPGSIIDLTDCSGTLYNSQTATAGGLYLLTATTAQTKGNTTLCLVERRTDSNFPISTTKASKTLNITVNNYDYPNNNFGRVIAANSALVLTKYQHINDCSPTLDYSSISTSSDPTFTPRDGFSISSISDIQPDECIAYKIVATNRANLPITNFVLRDVLQKKGVNNAMATAIRIGPTFNATDYATDSVAVGNNGIVKTNELNLVNRNKRVFYFNTKYESPN